MTIFHTYRPQRSGIYMSMAQARLVGLDHPLGDPWGGAAYGEYLKGGWVGQQLGSIGDAFSSAGRSISDAVSSIGDVISNIGTTIDKNIIQPVYQNVVQPVGNAFEKIGKQIAADPITFVAQIAAIAAAPFTAAQSLWALPVITAASTAAHGGSIEQILTATAISAATAWAGGAGGVGTGVSGLVSGIADTGMQCVPTFMGQAVSYGANQVLTQVATGVTMAGINALGAAAQGKDAMAAALPALIGTAAGGAMGAIANTPVFQELGASLNQIGDKLGTVAQTTMTGLTAAVINQAATGRDMSFAEANTLIGGLTSAVFAIGNTQLGQTLTQGSAAVQGVMSSVVSNVMSQAFLGGKAGDQLIATTTNAVAKSIGGYVSSIDFTSLVDKVQQAYDSAVGNGEQYRSTVDTLDDAVAQRNLYSQNANAELQKVVNAKSAFDTEYATYNQIADAMKNGASNITDKVLGGEGEVIYAPKGTIVAYGANAGQVVVTSDLLGSRTSGSDRSYRTGGSGWSYKTVGDSGSIALNNDTFGDPVQGVYKYGYVVTLGGYTISDLNAQLDKVNSAVTNYNNLNNVVENNFNTVYVPKIGEMDANIGNLQKTITDSANAYAKSLDLANSAAQALADKENQITAEATKSVVMAIDPSFNPDQYKSINGLSGAVNAYGHYLAVGKYQGLPTNMIDAGASINGAYSSLLNDVAKRMGYNSYIEIPKDVLADTQDKLTGMFGNNLAALKSASVDSILAANPQLKTSDLLPAPTTESINSAIKSYVEDNPSLGSYKPSASDFQLPSGYQYATQMDIAKAALGQSKNVMQAVDNSGRTVYLTQTPAATVLKQDPTTGNMVQTASALTDMITSQSLNAADKLKLFANSDTPTMQYIAQVMGPQYTQSSGLTQGNTGTAVDNLINTIREGSKIILDSAKTEDAPLIYKIAAQGLDVGAMTLDGIAQVTSGATFLESMLRNVNPNDQASMQISKTLTSISDAMRSDDMKASIQSLNDALKTKGMDVVGAVLNNAADNPAGMINFIGTNLVAMLPGFGLGKWVGAGAGGTAAATEINSWTQAAFQKLAGNSAINATRAYEVTMEASSNGLQAFNESRALLKKQNPSWTDAQLDDAAMSNAKMVAGTAALTTLGTQFIGLDKVTQNLLGPNNPGSAAFQSVLNKLVTSPISEMVGEGLQSGIPTAMAELLYKGIDSSRTTDTALGNIAGQTTLGMIAGAGSAVAIGSLQVVQDIPALAVQTNAGFASAINSSNYTVKELGTIVNQWIPQSSSTAVGTSIISDIRNTVVYNTLLSNPQYASSYSNAGAFIDAVKSETGIWDATVLADTAAKISNGKFASQVTTLDQAKQMLSAQGLTNITDQDALDAGLVGATKTNESQLATQYADSNMVGLEELQAAAKQENYNATQEELNKLVGRGVEATAVAQFIRDVDPKAVTTAEASQYFQDLGYTKATASDIAQFVKSAPETEVQKSVAAWVDPHQVTRQEAINFYAQNGYTPTEADIAKYVVQGADVAQADIQKQVAAYVDPNYVSASEVRKVFKDLGMNAPVSASDIARLTGQYEQSQLAAKAKEALPVVTANAMYALMAGDTIATQQVKDDLNAKVTAYKNLGMNQADATEAATQAVAAQFGVSSDNLLSALGTTKTDLSMSLSASTDQIIQKIQQYQAQGMSSDQALQAAIDTVAQAQGTDKAALLNQIGTSEASLKSYVNQQVSSTEKQLADLIAKNENAGMMRDQATQKAIDDLSGSLGTTRTDLLNKIDLTSQQFQNEISIAKTDLGNQMTVMGGQFQTKIQDVANTLGKPVSQVTANDVTAVQNMIAGQTQTNLAYDVNKDNVVDSKDLTLLQQQQQIQTKTNVTQTIDPTTGLPVYTDATTGKVITGFTPTEGSQWSPTGIYAELEKQKAQAAATAKAQAAQAKTAQQQGQFGQLMSLLFQAPDAAGQEVTVKTPDPAKINYIYDFSSIFATPSQAQMMPSPYGAMNVTQPQQKQQASNQPLFQLASGFAEGGIVGDINVGDGGSVDDLMNILKGNSG